jgi:hypothetical protein
VRDQLRHAARDLYRHCKEPVVHYSRLPDELKLARQFVAIAKQLDIVQACTVTTVRDVASKLKMPILVHFLGNLEKNACFLEEFDQNIRVFSPFPTFILVDAFMWIRTRLSILM